MRRALGVAYRGGRPGRVGEALLGGAEGAQLLPTGDGHGLPPGRHIAGGHAMAGPWLGAGGAPGAMAGACEDLIESY